MNKLNEWKEVAVIIAMVIGWAFMIDGRYTHADEAKKTHTEIRKDMIVSEIRQLSAKQKKDKLELWEQLRKEDLERQLKDYSRSKDE